MTRLFVYGTLKRGCKNHRHMAAQHYLGLAETGPGYRLHDLGDYPGMIWDETDVRTVEGEVWSVDASALARLDAFEGVNEGLYRRAPVTLAAPFDQEVTYTYLYLRDLAGAPVIGPVWKE